MKLGAETLKRVIATTTVAIAVIVIAVIAGVTIFFLMTRGVKVPVYPGAIENVEASAIMKSGIEKLGTFGAGVEGKVYTSTDSVVTIASWYRSKMAEQRWTKENDLVDPGGRGAFLAFKRGNDGAVIIVLAPWAPETLTSIVIFSGEWQKAYDVAVYWMTPTHLPREYPRNGLQSVGYNHQR